MLQILAPAGSTEAVIAAVQSGADTVYMGRGLTALGKGDQPLEREGLAQSIRYCRVRGCLAAVAVEALYTDETLPQALDLALFAAREGAGALVVRDTGLISALRQTLPDMPLWGGLRLGLSNLDSVAAAAAMGLSRVILAPELSADQVAAIAKASPIPVGVCVHGPVCVAHSGRCYIGAMAHEHRGDGCLRCAQPCRGRFSLGGRMDEHPLSMADVCLIDRLEELEAAGVAFAAIEGRDRRPEYVAYATRLYARAIREKLPPSPEERDYLAGAFGATGLSDGYFTGQAGPDMFAPAPERDKVPSRFYTEVRRGYMSGELRRVPVKFYAVLEPGKPALFAAEDEQGSRAVHRGFEPIDLGRQGISDSRVREILQRTGGTPFHCTYVKCAVAPNLDYPDEAVEDARRDLLAQISDKSREPVTVRVEERPLRPENQLPPGPPKLILQVSSESQLTPELAGMGAELLYVPAEVLAAGAPGVEHFRSRGTKIAAVLPPVVSEAEMPVLAELLAALQAMGVRQVLAGSLGLLPAARRAGMAVRGDLALNVANSLALDRLGRAGLISVTASCEMTARQIAGMAKSAPTEMVVYGRVPVMVTDHCLIRNSAGRCACSTPASMGDAFGGVYPVAKEFGCRNTVYDSRKIFLADHPEIYAGAGLWGLRLLFTTESPRECVQVTQRYREQNDYVPINASRGAYQKGALWS